MSRVFPLRLLAMATACLSQVGMAYAGSSTTGPQPWHKYSYGSEPGYSVIEINPLQADLRLYWGDLQGGQLRDFKALAKCVATQSEHLVFAANAGMFKPDSKPVGLLVLNGVEQSSLNLADGEGNFFMKPNGIFLINDRHEAKVIESSNYETLLSPAVWATQSGPLLVHVGDLNPDFNPGSSSRKIRSGIGVREDGMVVLALSNQPVDFYDFALFFQKAMKCPNALYLDGDISAFYDPRANDTTVHNFGPMFGLVQIP